MDCTTELLASVRGRCDCRDKNDLEMIDEILNSDSNLLQVVTDKHIEEQIRSEVIRLRALRAELLNKSILELRGIYEKETA